MGAHENSRKVTLKWGYEAGLGSSHMKRGRGRFQAGQTAKFGRSSLGSGG